MSALADIDEVTVGGVSLGCSLLAIVVSAAFAASVRSKSPGTGVQVKIADGIHRGARAFMLAEAKPLTGFVLVFFLILLFALDVTGAGWKTAVCFLAGSSLSFLTGWLGMMNATVANVRTAEAAKKGLNPALQVAFHSGAFMGMAVVGSGLLGVSVFYMIWPKNPEYLAGFGFGASSIALFARVGGGIFTKAADVGADLVGKVEKDIPEDDPRNPAVIADNVGDNVGDVAGMGADLFESYVGSIISAITLGLTEAETLNMQPVHTALAPLWIASFGIVSAVIGIAMVKTKDNATQDMLLWSFRKGTWVAAALNVLGTFLLVFLPENELFNPGIAWAMLTGLVCGILIAVATEYYTSFGFKPVQNIAIASRTGPATVIIEGLAVGQISTVWPVIFIAASVMIAYTVCQSVYGIAIAAVGMLSTLGATLATDAYGPVADNAGGIAEMAELPEEVRERTDALDALGNTTAAVGKGFAVGSAVLTALALMSAYAKATDANNIDIVANYEVLPGLLVGAMLPFMFAALTMTAVGKAAQAVIHEVRRQFRTKSLMDGKEDPDYEACVKIVTADSLKYMVLPGLLAVVVPIIIGIGAGPRALGGVLAGAILSGFLLAIMMGNAGGAWDNAKKWVEAGNLGGKGTEKHKAVVVGDTVGDPFKDTSGPSLNILIKLMSIVSLVLAPVFKNQQDYWWASLVILGFFIVVYAIYLVVRKPETDLLADAQHAEEMQGLTTGGAPTSAASGPVLTEQAQV